MRKYINGHRYDTETAKLLGSDSYSNPSDFDHWSEELYRTNAGLYFLHGEGGPASKYAKTIGQNEFIIKSKLLVIIFPPVISEWLSLSKSHSDNRNYC